MKIGPSTDILDRPRGGRAPIGTKSAEVLRCREDEPFVTLERFETWLKSGTPRFAQTVYSMSEFGNAPDAAVAYRAFADPPFMLP